MGINKGLSHSIYILLFVAGIVISSIICILFRAPFAYIFLYWFIILFSFSFFSTKASIKLAFLYISLIPFALGILEIYLQTHSHNEVRQKNTKGVIERKHKILGYAPKPNTKVSNSKTINEKVIYDVEYNIDSSRLRISPHHNPKKLLGSILFFGCSFTFGTGLNDTETMPYQVGIKSNGTYHIYNFGFRGYGPHQMLSAIDNGMVEKTVKYQPKYAIYQALIGHIGRASGMAFWDTHGPKYILNKTGKLENKGNYNKWFVSALRKSHIYQKVLKKKLHRKSFNRYQINLFIEIINESKNKLETLYPESEFHVLLWGDKNHKNFLEILKKMKQKEVNIHLVKDIFQNTKISHKPPDLIISKYDRHPSRLANEIIADYIIQNIIGIH